MTPLKNDSYTQQTMQKKTHENNNEIAETIKNCKVASLARVVEGDIDKAAQALEKASNPRIHNQYEVYRNMYEALGVKDVDLILKPKPQMVPKDPSLEHIDALGGMPFRAFPGQDHRAHITAHLNFMATNLARSAPTVSYTHLTLPTNREV